MERLIRQKGSFSLKEVCQRQAMQGRADGASARERVEREAGSGRGRRGAGRGAGEEQEQGPNIGPHEQEPALSPVHGLCQRRVGV